MSVKCWDKMRKAWTKFSRKIGLRKSAGHLKLQQDVRTCEYEDVHVLWELLKKNDTNLTRSRNNSLSDFLDWSRTR